MYNKEIKVMITKREVTNFRHDFNKAVAQLEQAYGMVLSLGPISYDATSLSVKLKAVKGTIPIIRASKGDFKVNDIVGIRHKTIIKGEKFIIVKINSKNIKLKNTHSDKAGIFNVSPNLLYTINN